MNPRDMITFAQTTYHDRIPQTVECLHRVGPFVDRIVIVEEDFTQLDRTTVFNAGASGNECEVLVLHKDWLDCFSCQRNRYLNAVKDGWVLVSDPDEWFAKETVEQLRDMIRYSELGSHYNTVAFNAIDTTYSDDWKTVVHSQRANDHKPLLFKRYAGQFYKGLVHEDLTYPVDLRMKVAYASPECTYEHVKTKADVCERAVRNFFMGGGGVNDQGKSFPDWKNLRGKLELELGIRNYKQFDEYVRKGNVEPWLKNWILKYRNWNEIGWLGSELRKLFYWYFVRLHPEENVDGLKSDFTED